MDKAIAKLKLGKSPGADSLSGEHLKHAHPILISLLTKLFNIMIIIEYVPNAFGVSTIVPVPKAGKRNNVVDGYRGISLTPVISKIFEQGLLIIFHPFLQTSERQFGFKTGSSCTSAIYAVRQTIEYFVKKNSTVTVCSLDMEKAFDKMNRHALFIKMMSRGCPLTLINLIDGWFIKSVACVRWGEGMSDQFSVKSGTRQGGVLSPALFAIFVNDVLPRLEESNMGCFVHNVCCNAFLYADDLILMSLSIHDMCSLLDICRKELAWLDMRVNVVKSSAMRVGERWNVPLDPLMMGGESLPWVKEIKYLGMTFIAAKVFTICLRSAKIRFFQSLNAILGKIGDVGAIPLIVSITTTNCLPIISYGLESCSLTKAQLQSFEYAYRATFCRLFKTFDKKIIAQCQYYMGSLPGRYELDLGKLRFLNRLQQGSDSPTGFLCFAVRGEECSVLERKYNVKLPVGNAQLKNAVWALFEQEITALI